MTSVPDCSVWWMDTVSDGRLTGLLAPAEQERAASLRGDSRQAFVTARALLRAALAERLGGSPRSFAVLNTCRVCGSHEHGQPSLPGLDLAVSISHSDGRVGVALASLAIGLDIEARHPRSAEEAARLVDVALTPAERRVWAALPPERRPAASVVWWSRKESVLKASGWGLAIAPDLLEVTGPTDHPAVTGWAPDAMDMLGYELPAVHLCELQPGPDHIGFLASVGGAVRVAEHSGELLLECV